MRFWILPVGGFHTRADVLDPAASPTVWLDIPVYAYLADTGQGLILFDTGCSERLAQAPETVLGPGSAVLVPRMGPEDHIAQVLRRLGFAPGDIDIVAISHLHFDHAGGNDAFPDQIFWIQRAEWEAALGPDGPEHYPDPAWRPARPPHLVSGDVTLAPGLHLLSTPGHTPGHQSLLVELDQGASLLITADAVYQARLFDPEHVGANVNPEAARASVARLRKLAEAPGRRVFFSHDPEQARAPWVRLAPASWT